jgi:hypothetical protein
MKYLIMNLYDEKNRVKGTRYLLRDDHYGQIHSHGLSYLGARNMYKEMGWTMGLEDPENECKLNCNDLDAIIKDIVESEDGEEKQD